MARDITSGFQTEIEASELHPILLFKAEFDTGSLRFWTGYGELTYDSEVYTGSGDLIKIGRVEETQEIQANGVTIELSGIPSSIVSIALSEDYQGRPISVLFGVLNESGAIIADPYLLFKGKVDVMEISDDGQDAVITVSCESELIDLTKARVRNYTAEDQKTDYPDDLGLDFVARIQDVQINWGGKAI